MIILVFSYQILNLCPKKFKKYKVMFILDKQIYKMKISFKPGFHRHGLLSSHSVHSCLSDGTHLLKEFNETPNKLIRPNDCE